jgi:NAD(P)-dependent dehydrogenase (short-subunit alcohol dehydrogenase family)
VNWSFKDKVALVTGAASGIGLATAKAFAEAGAAVTLADVHEDAVRSAVDELAAASHKAIAVRCNVDHDVSDGHCTVPRRRGAAENSLLAPRLGSAALFVPCSSKIPFIENDISLIEFAREKFAQFDAPKSQCRNI